MASKFFVNQRLSYNGDRCTVRWIGRLPGKDGDWLGVEWDDPTRGKHAGDWQGIQYFGCLNDEPTAASFVRPSRVHDTPCTALEAVTIKYAPDSVLNNGSDLKNDVLNAASEDPIRIGGKVAEEIGFDKIKARFARLKDLSVIALEDMRIGRVDTGLQQSSFPVDVIAEACPNIRKLDLSRNLLDNWEHIRMIFYRLPVLETLTLDGNRIAPFSLETYTDASGEIVQDKHVRELSLDDCLMDWETIVVISQLTGGELTSLSARNNLLHDRSTAKVRVPGVGPPMVQPRMLSSTIRSLNLSGNRFTALSELPSLDNLEGLEELILKGNLISSVSHANQPPPKFSSAITLLDLTNNTINDWSLINSLPDMFPGLTSLRVAGNPLLQNIKSADGTSLTLADARLLTIARVGGLRTLNNTDISNEERRDAETYYFSEIVKELSLSRESDATRVIANHPRYQEFCERQGVPVISYKKVGDVDRNTLAAQLVHCEFILAPDVQSKLQRDVDLRLPKNFTITNILGIIGRRFGLDPTLLKLVWESDDADAENNHGPMDETLDDSDEDENVMSRARMKLKEEVLEPKTRSLGSWVDSSRVRIRIEMSEEDMKRRRFAETAWSDGWVTA